MSEAEKSRFVELDEKRKAGTLSPDEAQEYEVLKKQIPGYADPEIEEDTGPTP